jgi:trehalose/maltose hydrolase-like predicted phosphorylase
MKGFDPAHEPHREALTVLGNGYLATRGAAPESRADGVHYPGTYLAGVYNRLISSVQGRAVETEHLVNAPNWLPLDVRLGSDEASPLAWWSSAALTVRGERRELDLRRGLLTRELTLVDAAGRRLRISQRRLVSMARPHAAALETTLLAEGWTGPVAVRSGLDGGVQNTNVAADAALEHQHWTGITAARVDADTVLLQAETTQSRIRVAVAARTLVIGASSGRLAVEQDGQRFALRFDLQLEDGKPVVIDKIVALFTSRDCAISDPATAALAELSRAGNGCANLLPDHQASWRRLWQRFHIDLDADAETKLVFEPAHLPGAAGDLTAHVGPRRRGDRSRAARGGLPRPRVLGRAVRPAFVHPAAAGGEPRPAGLSLATLGRCSRRRTAGIPEGGAVSLAKRQRRSGGNPSAAFQPSLQPLDAGQLSPPAARRPRHRGQRLAVL